MTAPDGSSLSLARAEIRATWDGRFRWLWRVCALLLVIAGLALPAEGLNSDWFLVLVALSSWLPAIVCSDLLSLGFKANPHPQREWPPSAILSRAVGRLAPLFAAEALWVSAFTLRSLFASVGSGRSSFDPSVPKTVSDAVLHGVVWLTVFLVSGLPYAATAALISSGFRKPRRWLVTSATMAAAMGVAAMLQLFVGPLFGGKGSMPEIEALVPLFFTSGYCIGVEADIGIMRSLEQLDVLPQFVGEWLGSFPGFCLVASAAFLMYSLVLLVWIRAVLVRRLVRHPYSVEPEEQSVPALGDAV